MAGSVNRVILIGHLGRDPEVRTFDSGNRVAQFSLATSDSWTDRATGEKKERAEWHNVVVRSGSGEGGGLVGVIERFVKKGHRLFVEGQLQTRKWTDRDGVDRWTTEVVVTPFSGGITLLEKPAGNRPPPPGDDPGAGPGAGDYGRQPARAPATAPGADPGSASGAGDFDDDVPF